MWLPPHQQSTLTELFQAALVALCSKHIPFNGRLELDGLVCITNGDVAKQIVVKIHKVIEEHGTVASGTSLDQIVGLSSVKQCLSGTSLDKMVGLTSDKTGSGMSLNQMVGLSSSKLSSGASGTALDQLVGLSSKLGSGMSGTSLEQPIGLTNSHCPVSVGQSLLKPYSNGEAREDADRLSPSDNQNKKRQRSEDEDNEFTRIQSRVQTPLPLQNATVDIPKALLKTFMSTVVKPDDQANVSPRELTNKPYRIDGPERTSVGSPASKILVVDALAGADLRKYLPQQSTNKKQPTQILKLLTIPSANRAPALTFEKLSGRVGEGRNVSTKQEPGADISNKEDHPVSCKLCATVCQTRTMLEGHVRTSHRRFLCRICLNMFTLSCNLRRHMKLHAGVRPHACDQCSASFSRSTDLRIHMRKHDGNRCGDGSAPSTPKRGENLRCQICEQSFDSTEQLNAHRRRHEESLMLHGTDRALDDQCYDEQDSPMELTINNNNNNKIENGFDFSDNNNQKAYSLGGFLNGQFNHERMVVSKWTPGGSYSEVINDFVPLLNLSADARLNRDSALSLSARHSSDDDDSEGLLDLSSKDFARNNEDDSNEPINYGKEVSGELNLSGGSSSSPGVSSRSKRKGQPMKITDGTALSSQPLEEEAECNEDSSDSVDSSKLEIALENSGTEAIENISAEDLSVGESFSEMNKECVSTELAGLPMPPPLSRKNDSDLVRVDVSSELDVVDRPPPPLTRKPGEMSSGLAPEVSGEADQLEGCLFKCRHGGCDTCWYGFKAYERHFTLTHNRFPCAHCEQSFTSRNNRRRHAIMHTDAKRHPCETCHKLFARPDIVKEHRLTHTRSYRTSMCSNCGSQYDKKVALLSHLKKCLKAEDVDGDISLDASSSVDVATVEEEEEEAIVDC